ncbi:SRPBCC family protein, partial [Streptomyces althioticus]
MSTQFEVVVDVDRPIEDVFAYLADGRNDPEFSPRVLKMEKSPDGDTHVGTVFHSTVKDAGMRSERDFEIYELSAPTRMRWHEVSHNSITAQDGGYDLEPTPDGGTRVRLFNVLEGVPDGGRDLGEGGAGGPGLTGRGGGFPALGTR